MLLVVVACQGEWGLRNLKDLNDNKGSESVYCEQGRVRPRGFMLSHAVLRLLLFMHISRVSCCGCRPCMCMHVFSSCYMGLSPHSIHGTENRILRQTAPLQSLVPTHSSTSTSAGGFGNLLQAMPALRSAPANCICPVCSVKCTTVSALDFILQVESALHSILQAGSGLLAATRATHSFFN